MAVNEHNAKKRRDIYDEMSEEAKTMGISPMTVVELEKIRLLKSILGALIPTNREQQQGQASRPWKKDDNF